MSLSDIVNVTITAQTTSPTRASFGIPCVLTPPHSHFADRCKYYTDAAAMLTDGFVAGDAAYLAVLGLFSQNPRPTKVLVAKEPNITARVVNITPVALCTSMPLHVYTVKVNGRSATYTADANPLITEITAGLVGAITALGEAVTASDHNTYFTITANAANAPFRLEIDEFRYLVQEDVTTDGVGTGIAADIASLRLIDDDWYALLLCNSSKPRVLAAAAAIEALYKIMIVDSADGGILDVGVTNDIASSLKSANYQRTACIYHYNSTQAAAARWVGACLPKDPGSITWKFKTLAGLNSMSLTPTEVTNLENKHCNHYTSIAGVSITQQGVMGEGEFIDVTQSIDFLRSRMQEYIFTRLANSDKVAFTDPGIGVIEAEVRAVLKLCVGQGILAADPAPTTTVPKAADCTTADKLLRTLTPVQFQGTLSGAIHKVVVNGNVLI